MRDEARSARARLVSELCASHSLKNAPLERLITLTLGAASESPDLLQAKTDHCIDNGWPKLSVVLAERFHAVSESGTSANTLGRALDTAGLSSLAYISFREASEKGVTVAVANMANLANRGALPAAGLQMMKQHGEEFDARSPGYPHDVRKAIEYAIEDEREKLTSLRTLGKRALAAMAMLAEFGLNPPASGCELRTGDFVGEEGEGARLTVEDDGSYKIQFAGVGSASGKGFILVPAKVLAGIWIVKHTDGPRGALIFNSVGVSGFVCDGLSSMTAVHALDLRICGSEASPVQKSVEQEEELIELIARSMADRFKPSAT